MTDTRRIGFDPVVDADTRLLVLGSLPGDASLKAAQYYAHPRNAFWPLIGGVLGEDLAALPYEGRLMRLRARGVGLWDVIASAERSGSLDAAIRSPEAADLRGLVAGLPRLQAVAFNGGLAARLGRRILAGADGPMLVDLPSSSPAHARSLSEKARSWAILERFIPSSAPAR
ncbi:MAG: DNA-deoxyinosine glycosylase [Brevundimonas sp.]|uniref:DNA-deoxyinosine glycosylase n=1 Tax=Brevundimonas albigilva TaxID=1312364 RepID=A0ABY4SLL3_9CAUL|nr:MULTISPECIES: DNA-deoxyinosine glycosylase [Brevundimonas]PZU61424.1 MAG: DNA-deoxyinosine glycosylase [Brevundimonas sp.]UQV19865.1 DNA-deoxyinosine glycosylase [Brevundimonas albigilva]URI14566.1 DNA-deoxyinosine glycosylase [Brevundimonas albigilva]